MNPTSIRVNGTTYLLRVRRRRYNNTTYTWVSAQGPEDPTPRELGDPWPCITPKVSEIAAEIERVFKIQL